MRRPMLVPPSLVLRFVSYWLLAAAVVPCSAVAQGSSPPATEPAVASGARVRITMPGEVTQVGTVITLTADTLVARWEPGGSRAVALSQLTALEVSRGRRGRPWRGAGIGLLIGAPIGAIVGAVSYRGCEGRANCMELGSSGRGVSAGVGAFLIGAGGALVGGVIGANKRSESWRPVALERVRVEVTAPPGGDAAGVGVALSF